MRYSIVEHKKEGIHAIKLLESPFDGIIYCYGKVSFDEDEANDKLNIHFEYEILDYADKGMTDMGPFESYIGDVLQELIHVGIEQNNIAYTGGIDESRTDNPEQSD